MKKRNVQWLLVVIVGFLLPISSVSAQTTDCCRVRSGSVTYSLRSTGPQSPNYDGDYVTQQEQISCTVSSRSACASNNTSQQSVPCTSSDITALLTLVKAKYAPEWYQTIDSGAVGNYAYNTSGRTCTKSSVNTAEPIACTSDLALCGEAIKNQTTCRAFGPGTCNQNPDCFWDGRVCQNRYDNSICSTLPLPLCSGNEQGSKACIWSDVTNACVTVVEKQLGDQYAVKETGTILPACAFTGSCRSVDDLLVVAINATKKIFGIMGAIAFGFFVYGGVTIILSFGNGDKVKKGRDVLVASVVGIIIAFSAYFMVGYILNSLNVGSNFNYGNINTTVQ